MLEKKYIYFWSLISIALVWPLFDTYVNGDYINTKPVNQWK